jgi:hypothetical protein
MGIPTALSWDAVLTSVGDFLGNALVIGAVTAVLALGFAPLVIRAIRRSARAR